MLHSCLALKLNRFVNSEMGSVISSTALLQDEERKRPLSEIRDTRVDTCLWLIQSYDPYEAAEMAQLSLSVPVIPVLAKVRLAASIMRGAKPALQMGSIPYIPFQVF